MIPSIKIEDYNYTLPDERIAKYPLAERDASKLLRYENGDVCEYIFKDIPSLLPSGSLMIFNDTKVVPARLHFSVRLVRTSRSSALSLSILLNITPLSPRRSVVVGNV